MLAEIIFITTVLRQKNTPIIPACGWQALKGIFGRVSPDASGKKQRGVFNSSVKMAIFYKYYFSSDDSKLK